MKARSLLLLLHLLACHGGAALLPPSLRRWRPELQLTGGGGDLRPTTTVMSGGSEKSAQELEDDEALRGAGVVVVGLTGGIASGKSTVARMLGELGADVIDTDSLGHWVYEPGSACFDEIVEAFGQDVVGEEDGRINRKRLGAKVFSAADSTSQRKRLEAIVWPRIRDQIEARIEASSALSAPDAPPCILVEAALLVEAGWVDLVDEVWGVCVDPECALERLLKRDPRLDEDAARARLQSQMSNAERAAHCDLELLNTGDMSDLKCQVRVAWETRVLQLEPGTNTLAHRLQRRWLRARKMVPWRRVAVSSVLLAIATTVMLRGRAWR